MKSNKSKEVKHLTEEENLFLPIATHNTKGDMNEIVIETLEYNSGNSPCPCCGCITIPNQGNAMAFICPVCFWEIDLFIKSEDEPSDQNHGLTLNQGRKNFTNFGGVLPSLKEYCRKPNNGNCQEKTSNKNDLSIYPKIALYLS